MAESTDFQDYIMAGVPESVRGDSPAKTLALARTKVLKSLRALGARRSAWTRNFANSVQYSGDEGSFMEYVGSSNMFVCSNMPLSCYFVCLPQNNLLLCTGGQLIVGPLYRSCKMHSIDCIEMCRLPGLANGLLSTEHAEDPLVPGKTCDSRSGLPREQHMKKESKSADTGELVQALFESTITVHKCSDRTV